MTKVKVIKGNTELPRTKGYLEIVSGIDTLDKARAWGESNGYPIVYWWKKRQRVYAIRSVKGEK